VPFFLMASGAVLLGKEDNAWKLAKRALRMIICLIVFSYLYYCLKSKAHNESIQLFTFLYGISDASKWMQSLWYLYAYLAYIASIPFLKHIARGLGKNTFFYFLSLNSIITCCIPIIKHYSGIEFSSSFMLINWTVNTIVFYPIIGYFIVTSIDEIKRLELIVLNGITVLLYLIVFGLTYMDAIIDGLSWTSTTWIDIMIPFCSVTIFCDLYYYLQKLELSSKVKSIILCVSQSTFGIYLIHPVVLFYWLPMKEIWVLESSIFVGVEMVGAIVICLLIMIVCFVFVYLLRKIPLVRKIL